jgi:asparagine synthase (glutamine-hydrolysing)
VKVGALLSGGLDSSSISVISDNIQRGKFQTYSIVSKHRKYSEEKYIDILSKFKGIHNSKIFFEFENYDSFLKDMEKIIYHNDEPFGGFSVIAQYKVLEMLKRNSDITVVLSGQGGDEILMGYIKYFFFNIKKLINAGYFLKAWNQIILSLLKRTVIWQFKLSEARRYIPFLLKKASKKYLMIQDTLEPVWDADDLRERQILDIDKYSVPALAHYEDRNSMAHSLEMRLPFLDHRLVNYVLNLPITLKLNGGWTKYILRKSIHELPEPIRWRKDKQGFIIPEELWLKRNFSPLITEIFKKSILDEMGIINSKSFLDYYRCFQSSRIPIWYMDISRTLIAEMWARKFFEKG